MNAVPTYSYAEAMADAAVTTGEPVHLHAATCPLRKREAPRVWRPEWDWHGDPANDPAAHETWYELLPREAPRLYRLWDAHDRTCPEARQRNREEMPDPTDQTPYARRKRELIAIEPFGCELTDRLRNELDETEWSISGLDVIGRGMCDRPQADHSDLDISSLAEMSTAPPDALDLDTFSREHNIVFGDGGVGKGSWTAQKVAALTKAGHTVLILDYESHPEEWSYRVHGLGGETERVRYIAPTMTLRGPVWEHADALSRAAQDACFVVIDSIVSACVGADPMDPQTASSYGAAVQQLARPVLSLAHVTKAGEVRWPFGSIFWSNLARVTWSLARTPGGLLLTCRKANAHRKPSPRLVTITYHKGSLDVSEQAYERALADMIVEVLGDAAMSVSEVVTAIEETYGDEGPVKADSVRAALRRGLKANPMTFRLKDDRWSVA